MEEQQMFRKATKITALALAAVTAVLSFSACTSETNETEATTAATTVETEQSSNPTGLAITTEFKIIYEDSSDKQASRVRNALRDACGSTPESKKASAAPDEYNYAVLIGNTGKAESTEYINSLGENEYGVKIIEAEGSTIILVAGKTADINGQAVDLFLNEYMPKDIINVP